MGRVEWFAYLRRILNTYMDENQNTEKAPLRNFIRNQKFTTYVSISITYITQKVNQAIEIQLFGSTRAFKSFSKMLYCLGRGRRLYNIAPSKNASILKLRGLPTLQYP